MQLISALKDSPKLVVDEKAMAVRRKAPMPERKGTDKTTIYATPIERSTQDELQEFFGKFGEVLDVGRYYPSVSIVYSTAEEADAGEECPAHVRRRAARHREEGGVHGTQGRRNPRQQQETPT